MPREAGSSEGVESAPPGPATEIRQSGGSLPEPAASGNAPGQGEGGSDVAQGYSAVAEAPQDSGSRTGRRNEGVGRDGPGASGEPTPNLGHQVSRESASDLGSKQVGDDTAEPLCCLPSPGTGQESPGTPSLRTDLIPIHRQPSYQPPPRSAEYEAAEAAIRARQQRPLDPAKLGTVMFQIAFIARHGRPPVGDEWTTGAPADAPQVAA